MSSKAKDDMDELDILNVLYYLGKLKDNKPDGEGALFFYLGIWKTLSFSNKFSSTLFFSFAL